MIAIFIPCGEGCQIGGSGCGSLPSRLEVRCTDPRRRAGLLGATFLRANVVSAQGGAVARRGAVLGPGALTTLAGGPFCEAP